MAGDATFGPVSVVCLSDSGQSKAKFDHDVVLKTAYDPNGVSVSVESGTAALLVAGFLFACQAEFVSPAISTWQRSGDLIIMVVLGGMATRNGPLLGALFFILVEEGLSLVLHEWRLIFGPLLVVIVLFANGGLAGLLRRLGVEE